MCGGGRFVSLHGDVYEGGWWVHGQRSGQGVSTVMPPDERGRGRERAAQGERPAARAPAQALSADVGRWWANVEDEESCASYSTIQHTCPS